MQGMVLVPLGGHIRFLNATQGGSRYAAWPWAGIYSAFSAERRRFGSRVVLSEVEIHSP